jgi:hypothetical protein
MGKNTIKRHIVSLFSYKDSLTEGLILPMSNIPIYYTEESKEKPWQLAFLFLVRLVIGGLQCTLNFFVQEIRDDCSNNNDCS